MTITKLKYTDESETSIQVTTDTGSYTAAWPCHTWHMTEIQEALDSGLVIEPHMTTEEALELAVTTTIQKLKDHRDSLTYNGGVLVTVEGEDKWFYSTTNARSEYSTLYPVFVDHPDHTVPGWRTMDGTFITLTKDVLSDVQLNLSIQQSAIFAVCVTHEDAIKEMTDAGSVYSYDYKKGWPSVYGE